MTRKVRALALILAVALFGAACDDDPSGPPRLTAADLAGNFAICSLVFTPTNEAFPSVDILSRAFRPGGGLIRAPQLAVNPTGELSLFFTPADENIERTIPGSITGFGADRISIRLNPGTQFAPGDVLLPTTLTLDVTGAPRTLSVERSAEFRVPRDRFATLAGISPSGLAAEIPGTLAARFQLNACT